MSIVLTGGLSKSREHFERLIEEAGGRSSSSVSKKTSFVVAGVGAGEKRDKALTLGVEILDEAAFLTRIMKA
jgi:DNA ligase (NAD+)